MLKSYFICLPKETGSIEEEWGQCRKEIVKIYLEGKRPLKLNIFVDQSDNVSFLKIKDTIYQSLIESLEGKCPAFSVTVHPPEKPWKIAVEAAFIESDDSDLSYKSWNGIPYVVRITDSVKEVWANGLGGYKFNKDVSSAAVAAFDQMRAILETENMSFNNLVRQWNYIGNILEINNGYQNYQLFNEVRNLNYKKFRNIEGFPAATGVGMKQDGTLLDFYAAMAGDDIEIVAINNPDQVKPYSYGQNVLKGAPLDGAEKKQPPQFERAVLYSDHINSAIFISGTASIIGQDTIGVGDIEKQTEITIQNILTLSAQARLAGAEIAAISDPWKLILLRVYIKDQSDFATVKSICQNRFPGVTAIFIEADICRDNLLVEIEAEFSVYN